MDGVAFHGLCMICYCVHEMLPIKLMVYINLQLLVAGIFAGLRVTILIAYSIVSGYNGYKLPYGFFRCHISGNYF
jgi:hypothetical protein